MAAIINSVTAAAKSLTSSSPAAAPAKPTESQGDLTVYELQLEDDGSPSKQKSYIRLPPPVNPYILRISIQAGSLASKSGVLHTNFPLDGSAFEREKYHEKILPTDFSKPIQIDLPITKAGVFHFFVEYDASAAEALDAQLSLDGTSDIPAKGRRVRSRAGAFNVDPVITIPKRSSILSASSTPLPVGEGGKVLVEDTPLPLDGLVIQSVIAKWMGTVDEWDNHLDVTRDRGYNMLHFTPLQQRGESGSPYSIYDQMAFDDALFKEKSTTEQKQKGVKELLARIRKQWGILSLTDVVWNHTANNSLWLEDHPESGYNVINSPHLEAALALDDALVEFSDSLESLGLPTSISTHAELGQIMDYLRKTLIPSLKLWEYYVLNVAAEKAKFAKAWSSGSTLSAPGELGDVKSISRREMVQLFADRCLSKNWDTLGGRYHGQVADEKLALVLVGQLLGVTSTKDASSEDAEREFGRILDDLNVERYRTFNDDIQSILDNTKGRIDYTRIAEHGPKLGPVTKQTPLVESLFTRLPKNARTAKHDPRALSLANNGWIWNANALQDFASNPSRAYLRREVIVWGDCVKLRYGRGPEDNPFLWSHMAKYTELLAGMFDGFRIDNCHSTPIHVGEKLLDAARRVNPDLYVCAELFTGSEEMDTHFVRQLGLNSLIREAMNGNDPKDMSRLLYNYGVGKPVGSMDADCLTERSTITFEGAERTCSIIPLQGSVPHAFLMDCTHDNESPADKRTARDALPTGALVTFAWSAVGSNKGFDDLYPKLLNLVTDTRHYEEYADPTTSGIAKMKRVMNHLHTEMALGDYSEGHLHQEGDYIISHRVHPRTHKGYLTIAHTSFKGNTSTERGHVPPVILRGSRATYVVGAALEIPSDHDDKSTKETLKGLPSTLKEFDAPRIEEKSDAEGKYSEVIVPDYFPPGSVLVFATEMTELTSEIDELCVSGAKEAFSRLDVVDLNILIFRADGEERDATDGKDGVYNIPDYGQLVYCGLEGWMHPLRGIMAKNDLGHPVCSHLRNGAWALDYVYNRLIKQKEIQPRLAKPAQWFKERFDAIRSEIPAFMRPKYFAMIINTAYKAARERAISQCSPFVKEAPSFTQDLSLVALQMYGRVLSASLHPQTNTPSLAAGLPHFAANWARCWGRDVFISLRGLFLTTGLFDAAREHILAFCSTLKHGLIPNLLDSIRAPRYNSRDSPWWMLQNIQDYAKMSPEGTAILDVPVKRRFPLDDEWVKWNDRAAYSYSSTVAEIIQEILQRHASGIHFREYNAGPNLDMQMHDEGFNIDIEVDWNTGFILGGNARNCGTWMDKMGESQKTGNKGYPGTPRDGAPVEITGLLKSTLTWVDSLAKAGKFPFIGVEATIKGQKRTVTYKEWADLLQANFEKYYFVPTNPNDDVNYAINSTLVSRRGVYKDVYGTPKDREYSDYQLRPNFPVAMSVAPELFDAKHALGALHIAHQALLGPLGMKTLDPKDHAYRPNYDNSNDGDDMSVAKGWNYHQGPEWVWPIGYFLRAYLHFDIEVGAGKQDVNETLHHIHSLLLKHNQFMKADAWAGLPELTNENGAYCHDSCRTQAWSASTILDLLEDVSALQKN